MSPTVFRPAPPPRVPVLVVGGGPAGLSASILLSRWGVRSLLVERRAGTSTHPKATGVSTRTAELLRQWGVGERAAAVALGDEVAVSVRATLAGPELARRPLGYPTPDEARAVSPAAPLVVPQDALEPILLERARAFPAAELRFGTECVELAQDALGVDATLRDRATGRLTRVRADYVLAADGVHSPTRRALGVAMRGPVRMGEYLSVLFRADLDALAGAPRCTLYAVQASDVPGVPAVLVPTGPRGRGGRWVLATPRAPNGTAPNGTAPIGTAPDGQAPDDAPPPAPDAAACAALVRRAAGAPDLAVEVLDARAVGLGAAVAERFRVGRVFLAGDAAHQMTPTGGMGMNTAVHDAHNLAWKLAAVLRGWAGPGLLDTYEAERVPVAERNVARSLGRLPEVSGVAADLGAVYGVPNDPPHDSPNAEAGGGPEATEAVLRRVRVGARAPHVWLDDAGFLASPLDLADGRLVLLAGAGSGAWCRAAERAATALGAPLSVFVVGGRGGGDGALADPSGGWRERYSVGDGGAVLLRPDGYVAWRAATAAADPSAVMARALRTLLARDDAPRADPRGAPRRGARRRGVRA